MRRVPLYRAMYSTAARQAPARVGQAACRSARPERGEEAFRHGVVPALAVAAHGQGDLGVVGQGAVSFGT